MPLTNKPCLPQRFGHEWATAMESMELATGASPAFDHEAFLAGKQTPVFFGSGVNNFGVMEVLDALGRSGALAQPAHQLTAGQQASR
jgi:peptide chain release factor 3